MAKVGYFEIQVDDFEKAQKFYHEVFGWNFSKIDAPLEYYLIDTGYKGGESINGGMLKCQQKLVKDSGVSGYVCAIYVYSIDDTLEKIEMPGMGYFAYGLDSEDNAFGLWENK